MSKNLDLTSFTNEGTDNAHDRHNKYTRFMENEISKPSEPAQYKGYKRINMAFTDPNYETILSETNRMGINFTFFVNTLIKIIGKQDIDDYIESLTIKRTKNNVARHKGNPAKRINLKFSMDTYEKISSGATQHNQTITQYTNIIIEVYAQDLHNINAR